MGRIKHHLVLAGVFVLSAATQAESLRLNLTDRLAEIPLEGAVIELIAKNPGQFPVSPLTTHIDQVNKEFVSYVTIVPVGSKIAFPNSDDIMHHVYSFSAVNAFDIPLYGADENIDHFIEFNEPGLVEIGCNIHDWMLAYIYVAETDVAAITDDQGAASLKDIAPGKYLLKIWHPRMPSSEPQLVELEIESNRDTELSIGLNLGRERRIRRTPSMARGSYR